VVAVVVMTEQEGYVGHPVPNHTEFAPTI